GNGAGTPGGGGRRAEGTEPGGRAGARVGHGACGQRRGRARAGEGVGGRGPPGGRLAWRRWVREAGAWLGDQPGGEPRAKPRGGDPLAGKPPGLTRPAGPGCGTHGRQFPAPLLGPVLLAGPQLVVLGDQEALGGCEESEPVLLQQLGDGL